MKTATSIRTAFQYLLSTTLIATIVASLASTASAGHRHERGDIDFRNGVFYVTGTSQNDAVTVNRDGNKIEVVIRTDDQSRKKSRRADEVLRVEFVSNGGRDFIRNNSGVPSSVRR